jgi:LexA DNA binding domain
MSPFFAKATISCGWYTTTSQHRLVGAAHPTSLRHDAAEAMLIGLWSVLEVGWLDEPWEVAYVDLKIGGSSLANPAASTTPKITGTQRTGSPRRQGDPMAADFTPRQGQFLAFIYYYTKINRIPPAETDMQRIFRISPPAVHEMVKTLERWGFITREPGKPRTIRVLLPRDELPDLE